MMESLQTEKGNLKKGVEGQGIKGVIRNAAGLCKLVNSSMCLLNSLAPGSSLSMICGADVSWFENSTMT